MADKSLDGELFILDTAVYHLIFIGNTLEGIFKAFNNIIGKVDERDEKILYLATFSLIIIHTISFLDEYNKFLVGGNEEEKQIIADIKKTVRPAIKRINKWKELRLFRNNVLAHNLRDTKKMSSVFERGLENYDIPQGGADLHVLFSCISMVKDSFESAFRYKLQAFQERLNSKPRLPVLSTFNNMAEVNSEVEAIRLEINANILRLKKDKGVV
jgi:hypothetical protein